MQLIAKLFTLSVMSCCLFSCASTATGPAFVEVEALLPPIPSDKGRIIFLAPPGRMTNGYSTGVKLDDVAVGDLLSPGFFFVDSAGGEHVVEIMVPSVVSILVKVPMEIKVPVIPGKTDYVVYRIVKGRTHLDRVTHEVGYTELQACVYTGDLELLNSKDGSKDVGSE